MRKKGGPGSRPSGRGLHEGVRTARRRNISSTRWIERQINDPYVRGAREEGYRSRAAFKLLELDEKFGLLRPGQRVLDLGAAPGSWSQISAATVGASGRVVAADLNAIEPIRGVTALCLDVTEADACARLREALGGPADLVLCDLSPAATGHRGTDHLRIMVLAEAAAEIAIALLAPGGAFVAKVFQGGAEADLLATLKRRFERVRHAKPAASRKQSPETYVVATGFRAEENEPPQ